MFKWKDEYRTGITLIDHQHKKLLKIGTRLFEILSDKNRRQSDNYDEVIEVIEELKEYTVYHFNYEEALFQSCQYSQEEAHVQTHADFIDKLDQIDLSQIESMQLVVIMDLVTFLADWIEKHILKDDMAYVDELSTITQVEKVHIQ